MRDTSAALVAPVCPWRCGAYVKQRVPRTRDKQPVGVRLHNVVAGGRKGIGGSLKLKSAGVKNRVRGRRFTKRRQPTRPFYQDSPGKVVPGAVRHVAEADPLPKGV